MKNVEKSLKRGDSIIEVLLAVAIFSAIAVTSIAIMNKGLSSAQAALESTMVRTELDAQAEAIRFIEQAYETNTGSVVGSQWNTIIEDAISPDESSDSDYNKLKTAIDGNNACPVLADLTADKYFLYDGSTIQKNPNLSTSSIPSAANGGLWVVAVQNRVLGAGETSKNIEYYDFYISACWDALNSPMPAKRTTIIRIHNPDYETAPGTPVMPDYRGKLIIKFQSGLTSSEKWSLSGPSGFLTKDISADESYDLEVLNESWNGGQTSPSASTFTFNDGNYSAESEGWSFKGWELKKGDPTKGYECKANGDGECSWKSGEIIYQAQWEAVDQFCLRFYDGATQISGLPDDCSSPFQELPSHSKSGHKLLGWAIGSNVYAVGSKPTIDVSTDYDGYETIPSSGAKKYYKKVKSVWAVTFSETNLKVLLTYDIAGTSGDENLKRLAIVAYSNKGESWLLGLDGSNTDIYIDSNRIVKKLDGKDTQSLAGAKGKINCWVHEDIRVTSLPNTLVCNIKGNNMKYGSTAQFFVFNDQVYNRDFYVSIWADGDTSPTKMKINGNKAPTENRSNGNESVRIYQENSLIETINYVNATNFDDDGTVCWHVAAIKSSGSGSNYVSIINAADDSATNASDCAKRGYELYNSI